MNEERAAHPQQRPLPRSSRVPATKQEVGSDAPAVEDRRRQLLDCAARLFSERGYQATTLRDIAKAAGILPGSIYHHFSSKAQLFLEVNEEGFRSLIPAVEAAIAVETEPWARLEAAFTAHLEQLLSGQAITAVTNAAILSPEEAHLLTQIRAKRDRYERIFEKLVAALPLKPGIDRRLLRLQLLGALNWTAVWYRHGKKAPVDIARNLVASIRP